MKTTTNHETRKGETMKTKQRKPEVCPNIDMFCKYQVIDDSGPVPRWKTIGTGVYSPERARAAGRRAGYRNVWINSGIDRKPCF